jgi:serralysin
MNIRFHKTVVVATGICVLGVMLMLPSKHTENVPAGPTLYPFCTTMPSSIRFLIKNFQPEMVGKSSVFWEKDRTILVYFKDGLSDSQDSVLQIAKTWESLCNVTIEKTTNRMESDIRVCFNCRGYNSLVGKENLIAPKNQPTMSLQELNTTSDRALFKRTVLHEFGHAMGFLHELQHPDAKINWDTAALYNYYQAEYGWPKDSVDNYVLTPYTNEEHCTFDKASIMIYGIPNRLIRGLTDKPGYYIPWPDDLSANDKKCSKQLYQITHKKPII